MKEKIKLYFILSSLLSILALAAVMGNKEKKMESVESDVPILVPDTLVTQEFNLIPVGSSDPALCVTVSCSTKQEGITENTVENNSTTRYSNYSKITKNPLPEIIKSDFIIYDDELYMKPHAAKEDIVVEEPEEEYYQMWSIYTNGQYYTMDENLQKYLYYKLNEYGITYLMPYLIAQAWQESQYKYWISVSHSNGVCDCGLFMFRNIYWDSVCNQYVGSTGLDIMNPYNQIDVICARDYNWLCRGYSLEQIISYHYTSEYVNFIKWDYYNTIIGWTYKEVQIK